MTLQYYNQPHITVEEQIQLLKSEGLSFENESRAKHLLNHISMFRLKSYLKPFRQHNSRCFKSGATFEQAYTLYKFDSELRKMVCSELEKTGRTTKGAVDVRSKGLWTYVLRG